MTGRLPAGLVCLACIAAGSPWGAQAGAFPLAITALLTSAGPTAESRRALTSHLAAITTAAGVAAATATATIARLAPALASALAWLAGCALLLALQNGRLRHPPALASGGAVLAGLPASAVAGQAAITFVLLHLLARSPRATR